MVCGLTFLWRRVAGNLILKIAQRAETLTAHLLAVYQAFDAFQFQVANSSCCQTSVSVAVLNSEVELY